MYSLNRIFTTLSNSFYVWLKQTVHGFKVEMLSFLILGAISGNIVIKSSHERPLQKNRRPPIWVVYIISSPDLIVAT